MRRPTQACYDLARHFEGCKLEAYPDTTGRWTIGYGHTANVARGDTCSQPQADTWLEEDMQTAAGVVDSFAPGIPQNQFDALTDFCYNVGPGIVGLKDGLIWLAKRDIEGRGQHSHLLLYTIAGDQTAAAGEFEKWDHAGGKELKGLLYRREAERQLFCGIIPVLT